VYEVGWSILPHHRNETERKVVLMNFIIGFILGGIFGVLIASVIVAGGDK
jgi:cytosine/uracil/thiamine/allantoin permease